jgi:Peptidase M76 family
MTREPITSPRHDRSVSAATSATSIRSSSISDSSSDLPKKSPECASCIRLLQHVLSNTDSKPARLLQSMSLPMATASNAQQQQQQQQHQQQLLFQPAPNGVIVQIPVEQKIPNTTTTTSTLLPSRPENNTLPASSEPLLRRFTRGWNTSATTKTTASSATTTAATPTAVSPVLATSAASLRYQPQLEGMSLQCRHCGSTGPEGNARAFVMGPTPLSIVVCHNRLQHNNGQYAFKASSFFAPFSSSRTESKATAATDANKTHQFSTAAVAEMSEILTHELTHIYDVRQLHLDLTSCQDLAYSEVRAAREAECAAVPIPLAPAATTTETSSSSSSFRLNNSSNNHYHRNNPQKDCVQSTATAATHNLFALKQAQACVQSVLDRAYADHRPFYATTSSSSSSSSISPLTTLETSDRTAAPPTLAAASKSEPTQPTTSDDTTSRRQASHVSER